MLKNQKGVTLVELLIVIVILGIIAAISVPAVGNIVDNAEKDAVLADAITIAASARLACIAEEYDSCTEQKELDLTSYFGNTTSATEDFSGDYLENFEGTYVAINTSVGWLVAVTTNGYSYVGYPIEGIRDEVLVADEEWIWDGSQYPILGFDPATGMIRDWKFYYN